MAVLALLSATSAAQSATVPTTIYLRFEVVPPEARLVFGDLDEAQKTISEKLADMFGRHLPWQFQAVNEPKVPRLDVRVEHRQDWSLVVLLVPGGSALPGEVTNVVLWKPGAHESEFLPAAPRWPALMSDALERGVLLQAGQRQNILRALRIVPLGVVAEGREVIPVAATSSSVTRPRAVLPLDYARYGTWSRCEFKIRYRRQDNMEEIDLRSKGIGRFAYPPQQRDFDGILVEHLKWVLPGGEEEDIASHLPDLSLIVPLGFFIWQMDEQQDPLLSLVPTP